MISIFSFFNHLIKFFEIIDLQKTVTEPIFCLFGYIFEFNISKVKNI